MIIPPHSDPIDLKSGIYKHWKGPLYLVEGYSRNASTNIANEIQVLYVPLYIDPTQPGPRRTTRNWIEFFETVCTFHHGVPVYTDEHNDLRREDELDEVTETCRGELEWVDRFTYMGPVYMRGYEL